MKEKEKRRQQRYPLSVQQSAVERMRLGVNVSALAAELGVDRTTLYIWKRRSERGAGLPAGESSQDEQAYRIQELEAKVAGLEGELGRASLEVRFFKGALRRIEESQPTKLETGASVSMPKSAAG